MANPSQKGKSDLEKIPLLVLELICIRLDDASLASLIACSKTLRNAIEKSSIWRHKIHQIGYVHAWKAVDFVRFDAKQRYRATKQWANNQIKQVRMCNFRPNSLPCVRLDPHCLFVSKANRIEARFGKRNQQLAKFVSSASDLCGFTVKHDSLAAGSRDGRIFIWNYNAQNIAKVSYPSVDLLAHSSDVHDVDGDYRLLLSGSRDGSAKLWSVGRNGNLCHRRTWAINERVWTVKISPDYSVAALASAGCKPWFNGCRVPLSLWDIETGVSTAVLSADCRNGAGVLGIKFESDQCLLSAGYDSILRLWDLRTNNCEWSWEETFNSTIYCLASDKQNSVFVGTSRHSLVWMLDKRYSKALKSLYLDSVNRPVYSVDFGTKAIYACMDMTITKSFVK